jgi:hypothetical protein
MGSRQMQDRVYLNDGKGHFTLNPRALPLNGFNTAVTVPFDLDADGDLDLFVGSRSVPGRYGVPPPSFIFQNEGNGNFKIVTRDVAPDLERIGMVTDARLINVAGDAQPELVLVGEWMSPKIFEIKNGKLSLLVSNLSDYSGWWYALMADDVDGDGDQDLIMGNRGENFYFSGSKEQPARLWVNDFDNNGMVEKIITRMRDGKDMPIPMKKELTDQIPSLKKQNLKFSEYAKKAIQDLFPPDVLKKTLVLEGTYFKSAVALNQGNGKFEMKPLPAAVQFSCVCGIYCADLNGDSKNDLLLAGNDGGFMPQFSKLDASFGHTLLNTGNGGYERLENRESDFFVSGDVKDLVALNIKGEPCLLALVNNQPPKVFRFNKPLK